MMALEPSPARTFLAGLGAQLPRPRAILVVSAHHDAAFEGGRATVTASPAPPTIHDFGGFPDELFAMRYPAPGDPALADRVVALLAGHGLDTAADTTRGLDHGAWVPLSLIYPQADIPVLQMSMPTLDPLRLLELGARLRPLREEGVLIIGSGFTTHGLPYLTDSSPGADAPGWSREFDAWAGERFAAGDVDALIDFRAKAPGMPYAHPTIEHFAPLFVTLGASSDPEQVSRQVVDGYWMGLAKRSIQVA